MDILIFLIFVNFGLFAFAFLLITIDLWKTKKLGVKGKKVRNLTKLSGYSYAIGMLSMIMMIFIAIFYSL